MEVRRSYYAGLLPASRNKSGIVDCELDMVRVAYRPQVAVGRIAKLISWLMPQGRPVGPPMRSVGRELEEAYPSHDH